MGRYQVMLITKRIGVQNGEIIVQQPNNKTFNSFVKYHSDT